MYNKDIKIKTKDKDKRNEEKGEEFEFIPDTDDQTGKLKKEAKDGFFEKAKNKLPGAREVYEQTKEILKDKEIRHQVYKTMIGTVASVLGVKSFYDVPEYFRERFKVRGLFGKGKGVGGSVEELLAASWQTQERLGKKEFEGEKSYQVREVIKDLNKRLKLTKEGSQRGSEQRKLLAKLLRENRQREKMLKEEREAEIKKILDEYTTTKITGVQAMRQTLNTVFIASGAYTLRGLSYGFLDGVDRYLRLQKEAKRDGRQVSVLKDVIKGGVTETVQAAFLKNKAEVKKSKKQKILEMTRAWGKIGRYIGIAGAVEYRPQSFGNDLNKLLDAFEGKISLDKVFDNYQGNVERIYESYKKLKHFFRGIFSPREAWADEHNLEEKIPPQAVSNREFPERPEKGEGKELEENYKQTKEKRGLPVEEQTNLQSKQSLKIVSGATSGKDIEKAALVNLADKEKIHQAMGAVSLRDSLKLATIHKGEGIEHALIRQLKADPQRFGFKGDIKDLDKWAGREAHRIAIKAGYVDSKTGQEIRVGAKGIDRAAYVLVKNEKGEVKVHEYFKGKDDFVHQEIHNSAKIYKETGFEGKDKDSYEYIHSKKDVSAISQNEGTKISEAKSGIKSVPMDKEKLDDNKIKELYYDQRATASQLSEEWKDEKAPAIEELRGGGVYGNDNLRNEKIEFWQEYIGVNPEKLEKVFRIADTQEKSDFFATHPSFIHHPEEAQDIFQIREIVHSKINADLSFDKILNYYYNVFSRIKTAEIKAGLAELFYKPDSVEAKKLIFESLGITDKNILNSVETIPLPTNEDGVSFHFKTDNADDIYIDIKGTGKCIIRNENGSVEKVFSPNGLETEIRKAVKSGNVDKVQGLELEVKDF
jgi:hypothetical protein